MSNARIGLEVRGDFRRQAIVGRHALAGEALFGDDALGRLLDRFPRAFLFALTMGEDPERPQQNRLASTEGVSGRALLDAVRKGRLWLNVTRVDRFEPAFREVTERLAAELAQALPGLGLTGAQATLLVSSPRAQVYYHADAAPNVLLHLRGLKRVWVYPALDERFLARRDLEGILAGGRHEYLPYRSWMDRSAEVFDLRPGQWAGWPQNAPHRVVNLEGLNVSLSIELFTRAGRRRARVYSANRFLRALGLSDLSARESGLGASTKVLVHRLARRVGLEELPPKKHVVSCRVDPASPDGVAPYAGSCASRRLEVRCLRSLEEVAPWRQAMAGLNRASRRPDPFSTYEYLEAFLRHDELDTPERGRELWFLAAFEGERLAGYFALQRVRMRALGIRAARVEAVLSRDCDRPHLVARPEDEERCARAMLGWLYERRGDYSVLELWQQDDASPFRRLLGEAPRGLYEREVEARDNWTLALPFGSFEDYRRACSKKQRNNVARAARALLASGQVQHLASDDPAITPLLLELYTRAERKSWKARAQGTISQNARRLEFFRALLQKGGPLRPVVSVMLLDGEPIAGLIDGIFEDTQYALQICYDAGRAEASPGLLMLSLAIRRALAQGCREYNLMSGFGYYKARLLAQRTPARTVQVFRVGTPLYLRARLGDWKRKLLPARAEAAYNEARRQVERRRRATGQAAARPADRAWVSARVEQALGLGCEHLEGEALYQVFLAPGGSSPARPTLSLAGATSDMGRAPAV